MVYSVACMFFFFFQAEDGIRDYKVTGVQTCALPICVSRSLLPDRPGARRAGGVRRPTRRGGAARSRRRPLGLWPAAHPRPGRERRGPAPRVPQDRKSTRLNSRHLVISYAVLCLKKKKLTTNQP